MHLDHFAQTLQYGLEPPGQIRFRRLDAAAGDIGELAAVFTDDTESGYAQPGIDAEYGYGGVRHRAIIALRDRPTRRSSPWYRHPARHRAPPARPAVFACARRHPRSSPFRSRASS